MNIRGISRHLLNNRPRFATEDRSYNDGYIAVLGGVNRILYEIFHESSNQEAIVELERFLKEIIDVYAKDIDPKALPRLEITPRLFSALEIILRLINEESK